MVPGITETACRITGLRYQELHAEVDRQRRIDAAIPAPSVQVQVMAAIRRSIGAVREQGRPLLAGVLDHGPAEASPAPRTMAAN